MGIRTNTALNLAGTIAPVAVMLVTVPVLIATLGEARFGVLSLVWLLSGYVLFFDFGIGQAINFELAKLKEASAEERANLFWLALLMAALFSLFGVPVLYGLAYWVFAYLIDMPDIIRAEVLSVLPWIAGSLPLSILNGFFIGALAGRDRFGLLNTSRAVGQTLVSCVQVVAALAIGATLEVVVPAAIAATSISVGLVAVFAFTAVPACSRPSLAALGDARRILGYGGWVSVGSLARQVIANSDRLVIGWINGAQAVAVYAVVINLMRRLNMVPRALAEALFPAVTGQQGDAQNELIRKAIRIQAALGLAVAGGMAIAVEPFLWLWLGADFAARAAPLAQLVAVFAYISGLNGLGVALVRASGDPRFASLVLVSQIVPFFVGLYFGSLLYGVMGVAVVCILRALFDMGRLFARLKMLRGITLLSAPILAFLLSGLAFPLFFASPWQPSALAVRFAAGLIVALWCLWLAPELISLVPERMRVWDQRARHEGEGQS
ncbi:MAG: oligosaccharide flippase family protein [Pseudomonadota bacterium]